MPKRLATLVSDLETLLPPPWLPEHQWEAWNQLPATTRAAINRPRDPKWQMVALLESLPATTRRAVLQRLRIAAPTIADTIERLL